MAILDTRIPDENQRRMQSGKPPMTEDEAAKYVADLDSAQVVTAAELPSEPLEASFADEDFPTEDQPPETPAAEPGDEASATTEN